MQPVSGHSLPPIFEPSSAFEHLSWPAPGSYSCHAIFVHRRTAVCPEVSCIRPGLGVESVGKPSSNSFTHNPPECLVCDIQSSGSCPVCGQDFCSTHLYLCADCGNQYCSNCFDDHNSDGHWTDSDTAAELSHAQHSGSKYAAARYRVSATPLASDHVCGSSTLSSTVSRFISLLFFKGRSVCRYLLGPSSGPGSFPQCKLLPEVSL